MELKFASFPGAVAKGWGTLWRAAALVGALGFAGIASAQTTIIDPNFKVCPLGTASVSNCNGDPNLITTAGVTVGVEGNSPGAGPLDPFLLLIAVPTGTAAPTIGSSTGLSVTFATTAMYGQTNTPTAGLLSGLFTSGDLYSFAGLTNGNSSMNFTNMTGTAEQTALGFIPASFTVYEIVVNVLSAIDGTNLGGAPTVYDINLGLAVGDFVAAYGIEIFPLPTHGSDHVYDSAFTVSGLVTTTTTTTSGTSFTTGQIPEPGTLALLGLAMLGLTFSRKLARRR